MGQLTVLQAQQATAAAHFLGIAGNQLIGQIKTKITGFHEQHRIRVNNGRELYPRGQVMAIEIAR